MRSIGFAVPGLKRYENDFYKNRPFSFTALSVTGTKCECHCAHCNAFLLRSMADAGTPEKFVFYVDKALKAGCRGILVSGGSDSGGSVPLLPHMDGIKYAKKKGLSVIVHTGLADEKTALALKAADVDQVLLDVIGSRKTIDAVYRTDKTPEDYFRSMLFCMDAGLKIAPHLVIGLDFGKIESEYRTIDFIAHAGAEALVLVLLVPKRGTKMENVTPPAIAEVVDVLRYASRRMRHSKITLGCARPFAYSQELEKAAVDLHFDAIAFPHEETIRYAKTLGLNTVFFEKCCSLV